MFLSSSRFASSLTHLLINLYIIYHLPSTTSTPSTIYRRRRRAIRSPLLTGSSAARSAREAPSQPAGQSCSQSTGRPFMADAPREIRHRSFRGHGDARERLMVQRPSRWTLPTAAGSGTARHAVAVRGDRFPGLIGPQGEMFGRLVLCVWW